MITLKPLYAAPLPVAKTALYTCPANTTATVRGIRICNVDTLARHFILYFKKSGGTSTVMYDRTIGAKHTSEERTCDITMQAGDAIEGQSPDGATYFDCTLSGFEEALAVI